MNAITQAELEVMEIIWADNPLAASDVIERLSPHKDWNERTVKTLLSRLVDKKALKTEPDGRRYLYSPLISRKSYVSRAARRLTDRLFSGRAAPLIAHLAEDKGLSPRDIEELEALIQSLKS